MAAENNKLQTFKTVRYLISIKNISIFSHVHKAYGYPLSKYIGTLICILVIPCILIDV